MSTPRTITIPHILQRVIAHTSGTTHVTWSPANGWNDDASADEAFVFPSFDLAQRYASYLMRSANRVYMPVAAPDSLSSVQVVGRRCDTCGCTDSFACPERCWWHGKNRCSTCAGAKPLMAWAIYRQPLDFPFGFLARRYVGEVPTTDVITGCTLEAVNEKLPPNLLRFAPSPTDDASLAETWVFH